MTHKLDRVLVVGPARSKGGITSVISAHSKMNVWRDFHCESLNTFDDAGTAAKWRTALGAYIRAPRLLHHCSIVHVHLAGWSSMLRKLPILMLAKLLHKRVIVHLHAPGVEWIMGGTRGWLFRVICARSDCLVVLSPWWRAQLLAAGFTNQIRVVPNPVPLQKLPVRPTSIRAQILFVGKLEQRKGYSDLLHAAAKVLRLYPESEFTLVGHGEIAQALKLAQDLGIGRSVRLTGWLRGNAIQSCYRTATIFCLPSYGEGLPMSLLEAMSWALPVLTTPVGGIPDLIAHQVNGILVRPGDINGIAQAIGSLLEDEPERVRIGIAARASVQRFCNPAVISDTLRELYQSLSRYKTSRMRSVRSALDQTAAADPDQTPLSQN